MKRQRWLSLFLAAALSVGLLAGCGAPAEPTSTPEAASPAPSASEPSETSAQRTEVNLAMLNGPTGMGAAKLIADAAAGTTLNDYNVQVASQPTDLTAKLNTGEVDIAALPTNVAASYYNKTGSIQMLALNTLGVLYLLENGTSVNTLADLKGQTLYATGQGANPEYVLDYLLTLNGVDPDTEVDIQWKTSEEVQALMVSGEAKLAMLPVPAATGVLMQNSDVRAAIDFNTAWDEAGAEGTFTMGCVVVRNEFLEENPQAVEDFLTEYAASIEYVRDNPEEAAPLVVEAGIVPKEPIALAAIPQANLVCITGSDMLSIRDYYTVLYNANPDSIGGANPDDAFYYLP